MESSTLEITGQKHTRHLEDKTRMTVGGKRYRLGNINHPYHKVYIEHGRSEVYKQMGLHKNTAKEIRKEVLKLYDKVESGYIYAITNPAWKEWVKIGMAVDSADRCNSYQTSSPYRDYQVIYTFPTLHRRLSEKKVHSFVTKHAHERKGEWFKLDKTLAIMLLDKMKKE